MKENVSCTRMILFTILAILLINVIKYFDYTNGFKHIAISTLLYPVYIIALLLLVGNAIAILVLIATLIFKVDLKRIFKKDKVEYFIPISITTIIIAAILDVLLCRINGISLMDIILDFVIGGSWGPDDAILV